MASNVNKSESSSLGSDDPGDDMHAFDEEEDDVSVSSLKQDLFAELKRSMEAELNDMRQEISKLRAERDQAVSVAHQLRELLNVRSSAEVPANIVRTPPRKVPKVWTESSQSATNSADFPALPSRPAAASGASAKPQKTAQSAPSTVFGVVTATASASSVRGSAASASTSRGAAASASTSRGAAARSSGMDAAKDANDSSKYKKILQAINTDVFQVRRVLVSASVNNFSVKQVSKKGPVKVTISDEKEVATVKKTLAEAKMSFHEFKTPEEKLKCYVIRGLVGATEAELPFIKEQLVLAGVPDNVIVSLHVTGFMRANPSGEISAPVKMVVPSGFDEKVLLPIKHINHMAVRFELFKSKSVIQCKNCQRFGHSASGCQHEHRCVKCGLNHYRDSCPRTLDRSVKLLCCNCGGEHTANNLNSCPFFLERFGSNKAAAAPAVSASAVKLRPPPAPIQPGVSYAGVVGSNHRSRAQTSGIRQRNVINNRNDNNFNSNNRNENTLNYNNNNNDFNDAITMLSSQLGQIMAKLEEHSLMWSRHDKLIKVLMSNALNG